MKGILGLMSALVLTVSMVAAAHAAPAQVAGKGNASGLNNWKKAVRSKQAQDNKVRAVKKQAYALRQQAQAQRAAVR